MSLIARINQTKQTSLITKAINMPSGRGNSYQLINGRLVSYSDNQQTYLQKGYDINDIVYSIVNLIMDKCRVAPWSIYKITDENAYKALRGIQQKKNWTAKDYSMAVNLQKKALTPAPNPGKWGELIKYPNQYDTWNDFIANGIGYKLLVGNKYVWGNIITGGANKGTPRELWLFPAQSVNIFSTDTFPCRVVKYNVNLWPTIYYQPEEVLHEKYWNPNWQVNGAQLYGIPPLRAALGLLNRSNSSMSASTSAYQNEGIKGILHMKGVPGESDGAELIKEVASLKETMITEWSGSANKGRMGLSGYDVGWLPIGQNSEEMQIIESEKWDLRRLCNVYGVMSQMLNDPDNKTYANQEEAEKALTTRAALPALVSARDSLNRKANEDWGLDKSMCADFDLSVYGELMTDVSKTADWTSKLIGVIPDEQRELCNLGASNDPIMKEVWVIYNGNRVPLSWLVTEFSMTEVDQILNDES